MSPYDYCTRIDYGAWAYVREYGGLWLLFVFGIYAVWQICRTCRLVNGWYKEPFTDDDEESEPQS